MKARHVFVSIFSSRQQRSNAICVWETCWITLFKHIEDVAIAAYFSRMRWKANHLHTITSSYCSVKSTYVASRLLGVTIFIANSVHMYIQGVRVKYFRTPKRGRVHSDDSKSCSNAGWKMLSWSGDVHRSTIKKRDRKWKIVLIIHVKKQNISVRSIFHRLRFIPQISDAWKSEHFGILKAYLEFLRQLLRFLQPAPQHCQ